MKKRAHKKTIGLTLSKTVKDRAHKLRIMDGRSSVTNYIEALVNAAWDARRPRNVKS